MFLCEMLYLGGERNALTRFIDAMSGHGNMTQTPPAAATVGYVSAITIPMGWYNNIPFFASTPISLVNKHNKWDRYELNSV